MSTGGVSTPATRKKRFHSILADYNRVLGITTLEREGETVIALSTPPKRMPTTLLRTYERERELAWDEVVGTVLPERQQQQGTKETCCSYTIQF